MIMFLDAKLDRTRIRLASELSIAVIVETQGKYHLLTRHSSASEVIVLGRLVELHLIDFATK